MKVVVFYPYNTGDKAFSGGVAKVAVSNVLACKINGDKPYLVLPAGNTGLIQFMKEKHPYCEVVPVNIETLALYSQTKNKLKRLFLICNNLFKMLAGKRELKKRLHEIKPDVIHYHESVCYNLLKLYTDCKVVIHLHAYSLTPYKIVRKAIFDNINKYADIVISPTKSIMEARAAYLKNIVIVKTPYLNLSAGKPLEEHLAVRLNEMRNDHTLFSYVGRICRIKRIDHFLKALAILPEEQRRRVKYIVIGGCNTVGDSDYKKELESIIQEKGLQDNIEFVGYIDPIEAILPYIDYGAMLTESEAMPMVGIEYLRYGIPTIGYDAPGINDYVVDGEDGFLVKNGDVDDLAKNLSRALETSKDTFKENIERMVKDYTVESFAKALKEVYRCEN